MDIDILVEAKEWETLALDDMVSQALQATLAQFGMDPACVEISVLACGDERMAVLNSEFRDKPTPTNVLSWPVDDLAADSDGGSPKIPVPEPDGTIALGDVAISYETCRREAEDFDKPIAAHVTHLLVHGTLHLLGYDHIRDLDAALMQAIETEILGKMGLDDPYRT